MTSKQVPLIIGVAVLSVIATYFVISKGLIGTTDTSKAKTKQDIVVRYRVDNTGNGLTIQSNNGGGACNGRRPQGCLEVDQGEAGLIEFEFMTQNGWTLEQFTICAGSAPIQDACIPPGQDLTIDEQLEFFVMDDSVGTNILVTPPNGQVNLTLLGPDIRTFYLFDQNTINQEYYYNIKACPTAGGACRYLDPPIENRGRD